MRRSLLLTLLTVAAFFCGRAQSGYALLMEDGGSLTVCNNVVVNNGDTPSNVTAAYNLFGQYPLFANAHTDFRIVHPEYIFNLGSNACATWLYDMTGVLRQYNDTVDLGAYEYPRFVNFAVFQDMEGTLTFCNNIIINNFSGDNLNVEAAANNYLVDGTGVFVHDHYNFQPKQGSAVVNAGDDACASWEIDISGEGRVQRDTVDIGAFESPFREEQFPVYCDEGGPLTFCNNIIINNHADSNVNVAVSAYNFVTNTEAVFLHDFANFTTHPQSVTVNAGDNGCVSGIARDLFGEERVVNYTVDLGAFEVRYDRAYFPVFQETDGDLHLCNNIIMNNYADTNVNVTVENNNFVTDSADIFMNPFINFRPKAQIPTLDAGQNSCAAGIAIDLVGDERVQNGTIDIGAYEYRPPVVNYPVLKDGVGDLHFCNNIIINNCADTNINVTVEANNLVQNVPGVFVSEYFLFMLADSSVAIDAGSNVCMEATFDLSFSPRVENAVIDLGAFERRFWPRTFGVYQEENGTLTFCNNIFSNNHSADSNVNVAAVAHNHFHDDDYVFADKYQNYKLLSGSAVIDAGLNACCGWDRDLADTTRVLHEVIDLGAFETFIDDQRAVVFQDSNSTLTLCNNVIILNSAFAPNTNCTPVPPSNIVNDMVEVFLDDLLDFRPAQFSDAVDAGDNGCNGLSTDLDTVKRISNGRIDIGAFEIPVYYDTNYAGGGGGGGSGGGGDSGGGYMDPDYNGIVCENSPATLYLCNNIIVNNRFAVSTNTYYGLDSVYCNLIHDTVPLFRDPITDFRLMPISPAVNRGRNDCNNLSKDIAKHDRVIQDTIDIGAFEFLPEPDYVAVFQVENHQMTVCNNIIINNDESFSVNDLNTPGNNLLIDNNYVFRNNQLNYMPRPHCAAVNHGENSCNTLDVDLKDADRIYADTIDIGAFEITHFSDSDLFVVLGKEGHQLTLCNNIIINNSGTNPVNDDEVSSYNLLVDHHDVFIDNELDYTPRANSIVINVGNNSCCQLDLDMSDVNRIFEDTIDLGAFEQSVLPEDSVLAVLQHDGHTLTLCNNIIVNNPLALSTNAQVDAGHNIFSAGEDLFVDSDYDYTPRPNSAAINAGDNICCTLANDLCEKSRVYEDVIDIGAFEPRVIYDTAIALFGEDTTGWTLCNNIIINNKYSVNLNINGIPANNIVTDNDTLFVDNAYNYRLRPDAIAVNAGSNACVGWGGDMEDNIRIFEEIVDIGAFEQYVDTHKLITVLQLDSGALVLCNNIISNNPYSQNINIENIPDHNIVEDIDTLFVDQQFDYRPRPGSVAVNQGSNDCANWSLDIFTKDRIFGDIIDIGAYEVRTADTVELFAVIGDIPPFVVPGGGDSITNALKLRMYNNIVIHNEGNTMNVGGSVIGDHNLWDDTPGVFENELDNYVLTQQSPAVDAGDNQWVSWPLDLKDDPRIACGNVVDQGAFELTFEPLNTSIIALEVPTDNCQGYYIQLTATPGAMHYIWSHSNEDTNAVQVSPLLPTEYTVIASNGGECVDTASVYVIPSALMSDSLGAPASVGKTFWLSYLRNHFHAPSLTLNISAEEACTGTVSNPQTGWSMNFSVGNHSVTTVSVPLSQAYSPESDMVGNYGILVETTDSVSVYAANYNTSSFDVTDVLPVEALSDEYVLQTYKPMMNAEFVIVATMDNTQVDITPTRALQGGHPAHHTFSVTLQAGQTYLGLSQFGGVLGDLSGTVTKSHDNKPISVFNGNVCALVPDDNSYTDHLVEQAIGVKYWGKTFAITGTESQNFDVLRVTALRDNTEIRKNGVLMTTIQAFQTYEFQLLGNEGSCYLETSEPAGVYLYIAGAVQGNPQERSDPSMVWIPPTEQMLSDITFATFNSPGISDHYVNIVVPSAALNEVTLDGVPIGGQFSLLNGNPAYAYVRKHIANGTHRLHCGDGFIAHCYGLGFHESYGYAAGSKAVPLKEQLFVNDILNTELPPDTKFCPYEPIDFSTYVNYPCDSVVWNFGDSTPTVNGFAATHGYAEAGTYIVSATLYITSNGAVFCSNLYVRIRVVPAPTITYYDTICQGQGYQQYGFEVPPADAGHYIFTRSANAASSYCDSLYVLELEVRDNYLLVEDTICLGNSYAEYGFDIHPTETGVYLDTLNAGPGVDGCDSLVILHLSVTPNTDNPPAIEGEGWPCQGGTYAYTIDSLSGLTDVVWTVPDSLIVMPDENPYSITLLFGVYADSMDLCVTATGGCGELNWCRTVYPQPYNYVQIYDTLCDNVTEYSRYGFELTNVSDSNDLFIRHDTAAGGCDSTTVLRLIFLPTYQVADTVTICHNELPYLYHDTLLADTGLHEIVLTTVGGCDSTVSLTLRSNPVSQTVFDTTVCNLMVWNGVEYRESGSYDSIFANIYGCDSVVTMHLTVHHSDTVPADSTVCRVKLPVLWNGVTFSDAGVQTAILTDVHGCDSVVVMHLTVNEATADTIQVTLLENNLPYQLNGYSYAAEGTYVQHLDNAAGCDSTLTIVLNVLSNVSNSADSTICESQLPFTWNGVTFTQTDTLVAILTASNGADSLLVMNVLVIPTTYSTVDTAIVENALPFTYNDIAYDTAGVYTQQLTNVANCDSILTLNLTVYLNVETYLDSTVCENELPVIWNNLTCDSAGVYSSHHLAYTGADSTVYLTLTVIQTTYGTFDTAIVENEIPLAYNDSIYAETGTFFQHLTSSFGCDSVLTINLTVHYNMTSESFDTICESQLPHSWNGVEFDTAGTQSALLLASTGADSTVVMTLTVIPTTYGQFDTTVLMNDFPYQYNGISYAEAGIYTQHLTNADGCDSVLTLQLNAMVEVDSIVCESQLPIFWNDSVFTAAGVKITTLQAATGADSTVVMHLTVNPTTYGTFDTAIVENALPVTIHDSLYAAEGTYTQYLTNVANCDSVLTVNITVHYNVMTDAYDTICQSQLPFIWNDSVFTAAGVKITTLQAATGADSTVVMHLTVIPTTYGTFDTAIVENALPFTYNDSTCQEAGTYLQHLTNVSGCDSILIVNLTVYPNVETYLDTTVCENELPVVWESLTCDTAGVYTVLHLASTGADSTVYFTVHVTPLTDSTLHLAVVENELPISLNDSVYGEAGTYTQTLVNAAGCDSVLTIVLMVFDNQTVMTDSAVCEGNLPIVWNGVTFTEAGTQSAVLPATTGADSTVVMTLAVVSTTYGTLDTSVIENDLPITVNDSVYETEGAYTQYLANYVGCDSVLTVIVTVYYNVTTDAYDTVCESELPVTWNGVQFDAAGTQSTLLTAHTGADSTVAMHLTVIPTTYGVFDTAIVENALPLLYNDSTYIGAGTYFQHLTNALGCDSVLTLQLTVYPNVTVEVDSAVCEGGFPVVWNDSVFDAVGEKITVLTASTGADSTVVMTLTEIPTTYSTVDTAIVENDLPLQYNDSAYLAAGTYLQHLTSVSGCDSVLTLNLTVYSNVTVEVDSVVCESELPVTWNGVPFAAAGTQDALLTAATGADSTVVMTLTVIPTTYGAFDTAIVENALPLYYNDSTYVAAGTYLQHLTNVSGCDSLLTLTLTVYPNVTVAVDSAVCEGGFPILWNDSLFEAAGVKTALLTASTGADSSVVMTVTEIPTTYATIDTAIVENALPLLYHDSSYAAAGTYIQHHTNAMGCDSVLTIHLTVYPNVTVEVDSAVCESALPFTWNDSVFTDAGTQSTTLIASTGADSTVVMTVSVIYPTYGTLDTTVVENALPVTINDSVCPTEGTYIQHLTSSTGCDSILTLNLSVYYNVMTNDYDTVCQGELPITWNGVTFTQAGTQNAVLPAYTGADSTVVMTLTVIPTTYQTVDTAIVQNALPLIFNDSIYNAQGSYSQHYINVAGCDSLLTVNLTVFPNVTVAVDTTVCAADMPFTWHGHSFTAAGNHTVMLFTSHGADSVVTYHLSVDNITATVGNITHVTCYGESTGAATATVTGGQAPLTYAWENASGTSVSTTTSISNRPAGTYTFTVTDHIGCSATATVTLSTLNTQLQAGTIAADQVVCDGEDIPPFTGTAASGGDNGAYQWQISTNGTDWSPAPGTNNAQTYTYPNPAANNFTLRRAWISQSCGTVYSNTVAVEVAPNSSDTITAEICQGEVYQENGFDVTADQTALAGEYTFEQHYATGHCDSAVILLLTVWPQYETEVADVVCEGEDYSGYGFEVAALETVGVGELLRQQTLQSVHGCDSVVTLHLTVIDTALRIVPLTADFCDNMSMELTVETGMSDYEWSTGETAPTIMVTASGYYSVTATEGGCTATAGYRVEGCQFELVLPNAITPSDGDGVNDYFSLPEFFLRDISLFEIAIFNRWGEMVYYSTDKNFRWNGEYRGEIQYQTIYNYVIKYTDTAGRPFKRTGSITVL